MATFELGCLISALFAANHVTAASVWMILNKTSKTKYFPTV